MRESANTSIQKAKALTAFSRYANYWRHYLTRASSRRLGCLAMIILDTHIWVRWSCNDLSNSITSKIERASSVCVSAISCWEIAYLAKRGRLDLGIPFKEWFHEALDQSGITLLPLDGDIARIAAELPDHHRDPSDRFIIATAISYNAKIISFDSQFPAYRELKNKLIFN